MKRENGILIFSIIVLCIAYAFLKNPTLIRYISLLVAFIVVSSFKDVLRSYVAYYYGDKHLKYSKSMSLNPINHINIRDITFTFFLIVIGSPLIVNISNGVDINYGSLKNGRRAILNIGLAGFASDIILIIFSALMLKLLSYITISLFVLNIYILMSNIFMVALAFFIFDFIPLPGYDMFYIAFSYGDNDLRRILLNLQRYSILIIIFLIYFIKSLNIFPQLSNMILRIFGVV